MEGIIIEKLEEIKKILGKQNDQPLNFNQTAQYLGFSHSYLYKLTSRKIIPCHRPTGKVLFFSKNELDEWVFGRREGKGERGDVRGEEQEAKRERGDVRSERQEARGEEEEDEEADASILRQAQGKLAQCDKIKRIR